MRIGLTYDLRDDYLAAGYSEHETRRVRLAGHDRRARGRRSTSLGHRVERIGHVQRAARRLAAGERWDLVFNIAEGLHGFGREAQVPALLDAYEIPYTFSDPLVAGADPAQGHDQARGARRRRADARFARGRRAEARRAASTCRFRSS